LKPAKPRIAVLISGSGTNLQAFIDRAAAGELEAEIALVLANRPDAYGLERARQAGIPTAVIRHGDFESREAFDRAVAERLDEAGVELVVLAGFMRILSPWFVNRYRGRLLNIHPALLPRFPGLDTHQRVLDAGDEHHGSTVHFVTEELDAGPCILQGRLPVSPSTSADELMARVQQVEHRIYPRAVNWVATGRARFADERAVIDGGPADGPVIEDFE
jgi:phosphoribosylglycinamide formyltransferase-1